MATPGSRFVCAINRGRDGYQVSLALYEAGLLERFVTDFYAPDPPPAWLPGPLARRRNPALPAAATTGAPASFMVQSTAQALRLPMARPFALADRLLARTAGRVAARTGAHLYCYAPHLPDERAIAPRTRRVVFAYHPLPALSLDLLRADRATWPQVAQSFASEERTLTRPHYGDAWARADAVVCASAMTRASLVHGGCPPDRIAIIPYGIAPVQSATRTPCDQAQFLFVGQGVQRKGLHHLIAAWQVAAMPDARLTLVCYDIDPGIRAMIASPTIRLLGRQDRAALQALYASADVFVMPSLIEGFGLVYGEALAHGCHVVGTPNTGLPDLGLPPTAVTLVAPGDVAALADALDRCRRDASAGRFDRARIAAVATAWRWVDFRTRIADHARAVLEA